MAVLCRERIKIRLGEIYRVESRRVLATLIRLLGDFDLAEEALHEAFAAALKQWPQEGIPDNPRAWLVSTGRFKGIDRLRSQTRQHALTEAVTPQLAVEDVDPVDWAEDRVEDDHLRLIFTCCHPALSADAQVALTLREVCGLTTEEIASAFLCSPTTLAQRIVRAKNKIRSAAIPYRIPGRRDFPERLEGVLRVIYLVFNEGYSATVGDTLTRPDLSGEAIRLGRLLNRLMPEPEVQGLLALMLLNESRRSARTDACGELVLLEDQDRSLWDKKLISEGTALVQTALHSRRFGPYTVQAAIAAVHAEATSFIETDWREIVGLYDALYQLTPSPVVALNRAVAIAMRDGPETGLQLVEQILASGQLGDYHLAHAARADLCRRLGKVEEARVSYRRALELARQEAEARFLLGRLLSLG
ncbi:RNA polymerase sigma factor [Microbulbifer thermotolerans]|uniref:RNA polymerase sigma factor n=1 Tax=Microbulbifer thermotolerans TaxID=252514 RepID=A0AB35I0M2_MICTH|nr:RNA polymerase sigma factor [Microbulbifer thermotolerans]MCX2802582.1 RNA polymerase sigma factor [Microbulbifer thermotolerans]